MAITPHVPVQSTGARGKFDAWMFRTTWMLVALLTLPMLQAALLTAMRLTPVTIVSTLAHQPQK